MKNKDHLQKGGKRIILGRGKGYLNAAGPQYRFIVFLIALLISYTVLLRVFQKLAEIVQLPIFLPIALVTLLIFIGIVGILYSHTFAGPLIRIRRALEQLAAGETNISLRLRDSDDPSLRELAKAITGLAEHNRNSLSLIRDASQELSRGLGTLQEKINADADTDELRKQLDVVLRKGELLDKAVGAAGKR
jgi:methyl-accepting chemotaxis protein